MTSINFSQLLQDFQDSPAFWVIAIAAVITAYSHFEKTRLGNLIWDGLTLVLLAIKNQFKRMDRLTTFNAADKRVRCKAKPDKVGAWFDIFIGTSFAMYFYSIGFVILPIALFTGLFNDVSLILLLAGMLCMMFAFWCGSAYQGMANKAAKQNGINLKFSKRGI